MAEQFQTSFIPKKVVEEKSSRISGAGILLVFGVVLLVLSLVSVGGVMLYEKYLDSALASKKEDLQQQRAAFAPELIRDMARLDKKLTVGRKLLNEHVAVTGVFELLQELTLKTVRFTHFSYSHNEDGIQIVLKGEGQSFTSVALQSDEFGDSSYLTEAIFSDFQLNERGNVNFSVTANVNKSVVSFLERRERGAGSVSMDLPEETTSAAVVVGESSSTGATTTQETGEVAGEVTGG